MKSDVFIYLLLFVIVHRILTAGPGSPNIPRSPLIPGRPTIPLWPVVPAGPGGPSGP